MKPWEPMNDRLFVQRIEEPEKSLIFVPDKYWNAKGFTKNAAHIGTVLSVGPGRWIEGINGGRVRARLDVKPGDLIAFGRFTDYDEDGIVLIQEADIMFKITRPVKIGIGEFKHNAVGVDRAPGSIEAMFD